MKKILLNFFITTAIISGFYFSFIMAYPKMKSLAVTNSNEYLGNRIFIDPGHGGKDNGTSFNGILEDDINLSISTLLYERLLEKGAMVEISRVGDYDLADFYSKTRKRDDFNKRINYIRDFNPDILISIHINSYSSEAVSGSQAFYQNSDEKGKRLSDIMQNDLNDLNKTSKKAKPVDFVLFTHTNVPSVLIECGFISNSSDRQKLLSQSYQKELVNTIDQGLYKYLFEV